MANVSSSTALPMQGAPSSFGRISRRQLRVAVAEIFTNVASTNAEETDAWRDNPIQGTFDSQAVPGLSVGDYFEQLSKNDHRAERSWLYALILADEFCRKAGVVVCPHSVHRITACALLLALKMTCDTCRVNAAVAPMAGVSTAELNWMEEAWLVSVGFNISIFPDYYVAVARNLGPILEATRAARGTGQSLSKGLIPDALRARLPRGTLHQYRAINLVTPLLDVGAPTSRSSATTRASTQGMSSSSYTTTLSEMTKTSVSTVPLTPAGVTVGMELANGACVQAACAALLNPPTKVTPRPPSGPRQSARPQLSF